MTVAGNRLQVQPTPTLTPPDSQLHFQGKNNTKRYCLRHQLNTRKMVAYLRVLSVAIEGVE